VRREVLFCFMSGLGVVSCATQAAAIDDRVCKPLKAFVRSVHAHEKRQVVFNAIWGQPFKDSGEAGYALGGKECTHGGYEPAKPLCKALVEVGSMEFPGVNAADVLACLSNARKGVPFDIKSIDASVSMGTPDAGQEIEVILAEDPKRGGSIMTIVVEGY
jgi:hypothetical protein